uniref:CSON003572 protein n=1 Tax=Culicoides sonorensis TaxID=179676 RepID=A0A336MSW8_CULSO
MKFALKFIKNFGRVAKNEKAIYKQLKRGPLKISIFAKAKAFKHYKSGFISSKDCSRKKRTNHAVVLLGAIKEEGNPLWYIRNSWGPQWGDKGHVKLLMNDNTCNICFKNSVYVTLKKKEEESIYRRLKQGPVKISIYAKPDAFQHYKSGFITVEKCSNKERTNHAVVLLGAVKEDGIPLWYIRNSYGTDWGINGHAKLMMGENTCGMLRQKSVYVTVK